MNGFAAHTNGNASYPANGASGPSTLANANGYAPNPHERHNEEIINHLYEIGFQTGQFADTVMHVHNNVYRLHAILLARSPYLAHLLQTSPHTGGDRVIYVPVEHEPEITPEGYAVALGYLYSSVSLTMIHPGNARAVLAAGCLLGGMPELCEYAYEACAHALSPGTVLDWVAFVQGACAPAPAPADGAGVRSGASTPVSPTSVPPTPTLGPPRASVFGAYAPRLRADVLRFLIGPLPALLGAPPAPPAGAGAAPGPARDALLDVFARLPFELFKEAIEAPEFAIGSDQARFKFAKDAIERRKRAGGASGGAEETVVLAFGGAGGAAPGSAVLVTRKQRRRPLWKVSA